MRKVTEKVIRAFKNGQSLTVGNTRTDGQAIWLHGNKIAMRHAGMVFISTAGWNTVTTRERLNGIIAAHGGTFRVYQEKHKLFYCGPWDGEWENAGIKEDGTIA
jgi:hypothetical protein